MMPKGVEHYQLRILMSGEREVVPSMMPKGVEHIVIGGTVDDLSCVVPSMMPKGVEHLSEIRKVAECAEWYLQ